MPQSHSHTLLELAVTCAHLSSANTMQKEPITPLSVLFLHIVLPVCALSRWAHTAAMPFATLSASAVQALAALVSQINRALS